MKSPCRHGSSLSVAQTLGALSIAISWTVRPDAAFSHNISQWLCTSASLAGFCFYICFFCREPAARIGLAKLLAFGLLLAASCNAWVALTQAIQFDRSADVLIRINAGANVSGQLGQRNHLATLMNIGLGVSLVYLSQLEFALSIQRKVTVAFYAAWVFSLAFVLAATASRAGLIQLCVLAITIGLVWRSLPQSAIGGTVFAGLIYVLASLFLLNETDQAGSDSRGILGRLMEREGISRWVAWSNVVELIEQSPWCGHGWRSLAYMHYSTDFSGPRFMEMLDNAHNLPMHLAVELGIPVAIAFCALVSWALWRARPWAEQRSDRQMAWAILLVIGIHSMVEYPLWYGPFLMTTLCAISILSADSLRKWHSGLATSTQSAIGLGVKMLAIALLAGVAYVGWDYHRVSQIYLPPEQRSSAYARDPLAAAQKSLLFQSHAQFAELQITPLTQSSAPRILELSLHLVKWSPEPRIIEKLIESAVMLGQDDVAQFHIRRYRIAYPQAYANWSQSLSLDGKGA